MASFVICSHYLDEQLSSLFEKFVELRAGYTMDHEVT